MEGTCSGRYGFIISVVDIVDIGKGVLQSNTGFAEYQIEYKAIVFKPFRNEVFDGIVTIVNKVLLLNLGWILVRSGSASSLYFSACNFNLISVNSRIPAV